MGHRWQHSTYEEGYPGGPESIQGTPSIGLRLSDSDSGTSRFLLTLPSARELLGPFRLQAQHPSCHYQAGRADFMLHRALLGNLGPGWLWHTLGAAVTPAPMTFPLLLLRPGPSLPWRKPELTQSILASS